MLVLRWFYLLWTELLSPGGKAVLFGCLFLGGTGMLSLQLPIHNALWAMGWLMGVSLIVGLIISPRIRLTGSLPVRATAGQIISPELRIENKSMFPVYDLGVSVADLPKYLEQVEPETAVPHIKANGVSRLPLRIRARKRGMYRIPGVRAWSDFPFGIWRLGRRVLKESSLLVLPKFEQLTSLDIAVGRRYQPGGIALSADLGESPEYIGNREYRPGDPFKHIDFKSWARLSAPAVREYQEEYYCRVALIVDTHVPKKKKPGPVGFPELEASVSMSAAVADVLARGEYIVDLFAAGPDLYVFRSGRNIAHFDNILEILACVDACRTSPFETIAPALTEELTNITTVIYVLMDWDDSRARFVRAAAEAGCATKVIIVRDGETTRPVGGAEDWCGPIARLTPDQVASGTVDRV